MKIANQFLVVALVPIALFSAAGLATRAVVGEQLEARSSQFAVGTTEAVTRALEQQLRLVVLESRSLADDASVQRLLIQSNRDMAALPDASAVVQRIDREWRAAVADDSSPAALEELEANDVSRLLIDSMAELRTPEGVPIFHELFVTNRFGANAAQTNLTSDYRQDDEAWWQSAMASGLHVGEIEMDESAGSLSSAISLRIEDESGRPLGVLKAVAGVSGFASVMSRTAASFPSESPAWLGLLGGAGQLVFSSGGGQLGVDQDLAVWRGSGAAGASHTGELPSGHRAIGVELPVSVDGSLTHGAWSVLFVRDLEDQDAFLAFLGRGILLATVVIGLLALLGTAQVWRTLRVRVSTLGQKAERIGSGDFSHRSLVVAKDEFLPLAASMDRMAEQLETHRALAQVQHQEIVAERERLVAEIALRQRSGGQLPAPTRTEPAEDHGAPEPPAPLPFCEVHPGRSTSGVAPPCVLVADDEPANRAVACGFLSMLGAEVHLVTNGRDAVEAVRSRETSFDLILMDCRMPGLDGFEATLAIRGLPGAGGSTPIVAMTGNTLGDDRGRCLEVGMDELLAKPVRLPELECLLGRVARYADGSYLRR